MVVLPLAPLRTGSVLAVSRRVYARTFVSSSRSRADVAPKRTNNKIWKSADEAVADLESGKTVFSGVSTKLLFLIGFVLLAMLPHLEQSFLHRLTSRLDRVLVFVAHRIL